MNIKTYFKVHDILNKKVYSCYIEDSVDIIANSIEKHGIGSLLVRNNKKYEGIVTEKSLITVVSNNILPSKWKAKDIMDEEIIQIKPNESIITAAIVMAKNRVRTLVVIDNNELFGVISMSDVMRILPDSIELLFEEARMEYSLTKNFEAEQYTRDLCWNYDDSVEYIGGSYICKDCKNESDSDYTDLD